MRPETSSSPQKQEKESITSDAENTSVFVIPSTWSWTNLDSLCEQIGDIDHKMPKAVPSGVPFLSAKDLKDDGSLDFSDPKFISEEDFKRLSRKILPRRGDIIYSRIGARLGKARLVEVDTTFLISYSCCLIRPKSEYIDKKYLQLFLDSKLALNQAHLGAQSIGVPDLGLGEIKNYKIPYAPLAEQRRVVARVEQLMALCDDLEARLREERAAAEQFSAGLCRAAAGAPLGGDVAPAREPAEGDADGQPEAPEAAVSPPPAVEPARAGQAGGEGAADEAHQAAAALLTERGALTNGDLQAALGIDAAAARALLRRLVAEGLARQEGERRGGRYVRV
jgi:hypothetical protein